MSGIRSRGRRGATVVPNWRWEDPALDSYELRIAGWLASHADSYLADRVTRNEIARHTGIATRKTGEAVRHLAELGIVSIEESGNPAGGGTRWVITFDWTVWETPVAGSHGTSLPGPTEPAEAELPGPTEPVAGSHGTSSIGVHVEEQELEAPAADATGGDPDPVVVLSTAQIIDRLVKGFYDWVRAKTGRVPVSWTVPQMKKLVEPFLAEWSVADVKRVLIAVHERGDPFTRQVIERHLDGRARTVGSGRRSQDAELAALELDENGNLID